MTRSGAEMEASPKLPRHIAIIMDGNGRWATERGLPRMLGHQAGAQAVQRIVEACRELGVSALTLYAFSWENWDRPAGEIRDLMDLLDEFVGREAPALIANEIRLRVIGRLEALPTGVIGTLQRVIARTERFRRMTLTLALSYGGRQEIVDAARRLAESVQRGALQPGEIDEALFAQQLYAPDLSDPDLLIRTSGEQRLSNFLLWQSSYTELYMTQTLWPDFSKDDLLEAVAEFDRRERRFGRIAGAGSAGAAQRIAALAAASGRLMAHEPGNGAGALERPLLSGRPHRPAAAEACAAGGECSSLPAEPPTDRGLSGTD